MIAGVIGVVVLLLVGAIVWATRSSSKPSADKAHDATSSSTTASTTPQPRSAPAFTPGVPIAADVMASLSDAGIKQLIPEVVDDARQRSGRAALRRDPRLDSFVARQFDNRGAPALYSHEIGEVLFDELGTESFAIAPVYFERHTTRRFANTPVYDDAELRYFAAGPMFNRWGLGVGQLDGQPTIVVIFSGPKWPPDDQPTVEKWVTDGFAYARIRTGLDTPPHRPELDQLALRLAATRENTVAMADILDNHRPISYGCVSSRRVPYAYEATVGLFPDDSLALAGPNGFGIAIQADGDRFRYCTVISFPSPTPTLARAWQDEHRLEFDRAITLYNLMHSGHTAKPTADPALAETAFEEADRELSVLVANVMRPGTVAITAFSLRTPSPNVRGYQNGIQRSVSVSDASMADLMGSKAYGVGFATDATTGLSVEVIFWR